MSDWRAVAEHTPHLASPAAGQAQLKHYRRVAASRAKLEAANVRMMKNRARAIDRALQKAAVRFLPTGVQISPRILDLVRWPYAGDQKILGKVPQELRDSILDEDTACVWCREAASTTIDHVRPLNRGGSNHPLNLVGACGPCNSVKADFMPSELGWVLRLPRRAFALGVKPD
jgi:hypothetical protein